MDILDQLPRPGVRRLAVRVTPDAARRLRAGHPWLFDRSITSVSGAGDHLPGDLAVVFDPKRSFVAVGLYDPASPIRVRILHHGSPAAIDEAWWGARLDGALARRSGLAGSGTTTAYRCIHGENDGFPGLVLDRYASTYVLKLYSTAWLPHLSMLVPLIGERVGWERLVLRLGRGVQRDRGLPEGVADGVTIEGTPPSGLIPFLENGLAFEADVVRGQKTGHFLDQRENRALVRDLARGRTVLDLFACTGGFSVHAAAGGATEVHSVDASSHAIQAAAHNVALNQRLAAVRSCRHTTEVADAFDALERLASRRQRFDIVVIDPPSFAPKQSDVRAALRAYRRLTALGADVVQRGGVLVQASCSSRVASDQFFAAVTGVLGESGRSAAELARTGHPADHPIGFPEGAYLKAIAVRL